MSSPGGPGNWGQYNHNQQQYYDPITGQPVDQQSTGYGSAPQTPSGMQQGSSGMQYQGFGVFEQGNKQQPGQPPQPEPSGGSRGPLFATIAGTVVVAIGIVTTVVLVGGGDSDDRAAPSGPVTRTSEPSSTSSPSSDLGIPTAPETPTTTAPASGTENVRKPVQPVVPGWQGMALLEFGIAYDIPPGWKPQTGSLSGFENDSGERVSLSGYSSYKMNFCAAADLSYRARVGISSSDETDAVTAARSAIRKWARLGWESDSGVPAEVAMNPPRSVSLDGGEVDGQLVSATITPAEPGACGTPKVFISVVAMSNDSGSALLIGLADQGVPGAVPPETINRSLTSVRWLPN